MATYTPKDQLQAYTRWEATDFSPPPPKPAPPPPEPAPPPPTPEPVVEEVEHIPLPTAEDIERIHEEAHASGYQAGYDEGYQAGLAAAQIHGDRLAALAQGLQEAMGSIDQELAESILACSLEVARQITKSTLQSQPEALLPVIREALSALPLHHGPVTLLVNPADKPLIHEHLGDQFSHAGWQVLEDEEILPGGCRIRAGASEVDATLPTRWRRTLEAIGVTPEWLDAQP